MFKGKFWDRNIVNEIQENLFKEKFKNFSEDEMDVGKRGS